MEEHVEALMLMQATVRPVDTPLHEEDIGGEAGGKGRCTLDVRDVQVEVRESPTALHEPLAERRHERVAHHGDGRHLSDGRGDGVCAGGGRTATPRVSTDSAPLSHAQYVTSCSALPLE